MRRVDGLAKPPRGSVPDGDVVKVGGRGWRVDFTLDEEVAFCRVEDGVRRYLGESQGWFAGGEVTVNVGRRMLSIEELGRLRRLFEEEFQLKVARFWCRSESLERAISEDAGVPVELVPWQLASVSAGEALRLREAPLHVKSTCRSGTMINHQGDVMVRGDVNPGAEINATGDVIVLGTLRGVAHAGANADDPTNAVIIALSLRPLQLRIGRHVCVAPADNGNQAVPAHPEIAYVSGHAIVVAPFDGGFQNTYT